jgi:hypothetical protein
MNILFQRLGFAQIKKYRQEIFFIRFVYTVVNTLSIIFVIYFLREVWYDVDGVKKNAIELIKAIAAIFTPYLTLLGQGYWFSRERKINSLLDLLAREETLSEEEKKILYDK